MVACASLVRSTPTGALIPGGSGMWAGLPKRTWRGSCTGSTSGPGLAPRPTATFVPRARARVKACSRVAGSSPASPCRAHPPASSGRRRWASGPQNAQDHGALDQRETGAAGRTGHGAPPTGRKAFGAGPRVRWGRRRWKPFSPDALHVHQLFHPPEAAVLLAEGHDALRGTAPTRRSCISSVAVAVFRFTRAALARRKPCAAPPGEGAQVECMVASFQGRSL